MSNVKTILIDGEIATVSDPHSSKKYVVKVLGVEYECGNEVVYLDSLIHEESSLFVGWEASGAISTILTRPAMR